VTSLLNFGLRVVSGFPRNQGLVLAGAVAYYTLLSIVGGGGDRRTPGTPVLRLHGLHGGRKRHGDYLP